MKMKITQKCVHKNQNVFKLLFFSLKILYNLFVNYFKLLCANVWCEVKSVYSSRLVGVVLGSFSQARHNEHDVKSIQSIGNIIRIKLITGGCRIYPFGQHEIMCNDQSDQSFGDGRPRNWHCTEIIQTDSN